MKNIYKKNRNVIFTFLIGLLIIITIYVLQGVAPFGKNSMLHIDFYHQYGPMLGELYDRIKSGSSLIYSFTSGLGIPFFRNFLNYLSSPFNIIMFLFSRENLVMSYAIIIGIKAVASAITMVYYLNRKFDNKKLYLIPIGILYAFSAYFIAYYWNIMWLDGLIFLPLVVLGIERIVDDKSPLLYMISLAIMLIANYFIGYMLCLFSVIYFIIYLILQTSKKDIKTIWKKILKFAIYSVVAGGLTAFLLLPMYDSIGSISATGDFFPDSQYYGFSVWQFLANHFTGVGSTVLKSGISNAPNVCCGILSIGLLILFVINPKISLKKKICYLSLLLIMIISFFSAKLDFIWQAFHVPNDLPYRYSFIYSFVLLIISAYSLINIKYLKKQYVIYVYGFLLVSVWALYYFKYDNITTKMLIVNASLISGYLILYLLYAFLPKIKKILIFIFLVLASAEAVMYVNSTWLILHDIDEFNSNYSDAIGTFNLIEKKDDAIYRIVKNDRLTFNDPSWFGYYGASTFSSMAYENMAVLQKNLGMASNYINSYYYEQETPVYDLMFDIKYVIGHSTDKVRYKPYYRDNDIKTFKSNYLPSLMYGVSRDVLSWNIHLDNPLEIQNDFVELSTGVKDVFEELSISKTEEIYNQDGKKVVKYVINNIDDNIFLYFDKYNIDFVLFDNCLYYKNSEYTYLYYAKEVSDTMIFQDYNESYVINRKIGDKEFEVYVGYNYYEDNKDFYLYGINQTKFDEFYNTLNSNKGTIIDFKESYIKASVSIDDNMLLYTSIPYDEGWNIYVDGVECKKIKLADSLLAIELPKGNHVVEFNYFPKNCITGIIISLISLIIIIIIKKRNCAIKQ